MSQDMTVQSAVDDVASNVGQTVEDGRRGQVEDREVSATGHQTIRTYRHSSRRLRLSRQGLTFANVSAQLERFLWDKGCA